VIKIKQYDIWLADLNPSKGTEAGKVRPVVIIQTDLLNGTHLSTLICPVTTNVQPEKGSVGQVERCTDRSNPVH
jgi:mRNA interferase MazF